MVLETTNINKTDKQLIADLVGKPYSFFQRLKLKGVDSQWMPVEKVDPNLESFLGPVADEVQGKIQLRTNGIVIGITIGSRKYNWAIPYYQLVIYKTKSISVHAQGRFIQFGKNGTFMGNKSFFAKLLNLKADYNQQNFQFTDI